MEIGHNFDASAVSRVIAARPPPAERPGGNGRPSFESTTALDQALQQEPHIRAEAVARAKNYIGEVAYPPPETIAKIANLLALHFNDSID